MFTIKIEDGHICPKSIDGAQKLAKPGKSIIIEL